MLTCFWFTALVGMDVPWYGGSVRFFGSLYAFFVVGISSVVVAAAVGSPVCAEDRSSLVVGSFNVDGAVVGVDQRTGAATTSVRLVGLPGLAGDGAVDLSVSYNGQRARHRIDSGLGAGWDFDLTRVDTSDGVRVLTGSGVYSADTAYESGLARYPQRDVRFRQAVGVLTAPTPRGDRSVRYEYLLETLGGVTEYFGPAGFLVARQDRFGNTTWWDWDEKARRLLGVTDRAGNDARLEWAGEKLIVHLPARADGVVPEPTIVTIDTRGVSAVIDQARETTTFEYEPDGLSCVKTIGRGRTDVEYQFLGDGTPAVRTISARDEAGQLLSSHGWSPVGERVFTGYPNFFWGSRFVGIR